ncbi:MAG: MFS transporter [Oscillospiraceae bacterium]|nr:MFS transporter [Oscillospiraceae bacterium]
MTLRTRSWLGILSCALATFNSGALFFGYPGILTPYWADQFDADSSQTGFIMMFACLGVGVLMLVSGSIHAKIGTRRCLMIGTAILLADMIFANFATSIVYSYIWAFFCGAGTGFIYGPCISTCQNWLPQRRGLASGVVNLTFGIAGAIMSLVYQALLDSVGYQTMNWIVVAMIVVFNCASMVFAELPSFCHLTEKQSSELEELKKASAAAGPALAKKSYTVKQALSTRNFWLIWVGWLFMGAAGVSMISLSGSYAASIGLTTATVLTAFNVTNGVGRIIAGTVSDWIGRNATGLIALLLGGLGYLLLPWCTNIVLVAVLAALVGLAFGTLFTITAPLVSDLFGLKHYSMIFSLVFSAYGFLSGVAGPALSGFLLDASGQSYALVFRILAVFCVIGAICMFLAKRWKRDVERTDLED